MAKLLTENQGEYIAHCDREYRGQASVAKGFREQLARHQTTCTDSDNCQTCDLFNEVCTTQETILEDSRNRLTRAKDGFDD